MPDRLPEPHAPSGQHVAIITGLSGAGKTATSKIFEDLGYTVVDNVPSELLRDLAELVANEPERYDRVAIVLDVRSGNAPLALGAALGALHGRDIEPQIVFLEASDEALIRRYSETRHRHPLDTESLENPQPGPDDILDGRATVSTPIVGSVQVFNLTTARASTTAW